MSEEKPATTWKREWHNLLVTSHVDVTDQERVVNHLSGWRSSIYVLPVRVIVKKGISDIHNVKIDGKLCRIYPPFSLDEKEQIVGSFKDARVPVGSKAVEGHVNLPNRLITALDVDLGNTPDTQNCHAIRYDFEDGIDVISLHEKLISQLVQFTWQWWLRSNIAPFRGLLRYSFEIDSQFTPVDGLVDESEGKGRVPWTAGIEMQKLLGFEIPVTREIWDQCVYCAGAGIPTDTGLIFFSDAVVQYMAHNDSGCILNLALCFEIIANKRNLADGGKPNWEIDKILRKGRLVSGKVADIIKLLFIDRDNVAHGREPHVIRNKTGISVETYLDAVLAAVRTYIALMKPDEVVSFLKMNIQRR